MGLIRRPQVSFHSLHAVHGDLSADKVQQFTGPHGMTGAQFHRLVDIFRAVTFLNQFDVLIYQDVRILLTINPAKSTASIGSFPNLRIIPGGLESFVRGNGADDFNSFHQRNGIHEMDADAFSHAG